MTVSEQTMVVILAAGFGSRLKSETSPPKPLLKISGRPLILRVLDRFYEAGLREAVIVLGYRAEEVRAGIEKDAPPMNVHFVVNPKYELSNGLSVLAARPVVVGRPFFISMADHIFDVELIEGLWSAQLPPDGLVLAVDRKLSEIYDMDDATKVRTENGRILEIQKNLEVFDAVDTGLFFCTKALFDAIERKSNATLGGDCSLSDGVKKLAETGRALVHDVGRGRWQDVDTPGMARHAEKMFRDKIPSQAGEGRRKE